MNLNILWYNVINYFYISLHCLHEAKNRFFKLVSFKVTYYFVNISHENMINYFNVYDNIYADLVKATIIIICTR